MAKTFRKRARVAAKAAQPRTPPIKPQRMAGPKADPGARHAAPVKLLSGGNPQIAKGDGDAPVKAYIAAMPGWKSGLGRRLDALIVRAVPNVHKAVRWNSPFYGIKGRAGSCRSMCLPAT